MLWIFETHSCSPQLSWMIYERPSCTSFYYKHKPDVCDYSLLQNYGQRGHLGADRWRHLVQRRNTMQYTDPYRLDSQPTIES